MARKSRQSGGLGGAMGGAMNNSSEIGEMVARIAMETILERLAQGQPKPSPWRVKDDLSGATREHGVGGAEFAYVPAGARVQPPMRGRPYTSYNRSRISNLPPVPVGAMNNLPFQALIDKYIETITFPPMRGLPQSYPQTTIPITDQHIFPQTTIPITDRHVYLPRTM